MIDISSVSAMVAAMGVLVGVLFALIELRNLVRARQADLLTGFYSNFVAKEFSEAVLKVLNLEYKDYEDFVKNYGLPFSENPAGTALWMVGQYCEAVGVLVKRKLIGIEMVTDLLPIWVLWPKMKPIVEGTRKQFNWQRYLEWCEYLYNESRADIDRRYRGVPRPILP